MVGGMIRLGSMEEFQRMFGEGNGDDAYERHNEECRKRAQKFGPSTVRLILTDAKRKLEEKHEFNNGDILRYKRGLESGRYTPVGGLVIFLRYQDLPENAEPFNRGNTLGLLDEDCVVGVVLPTGAMAEYYTCSRYLEPAPESEDEKFFASLQAE